MYQSSDEFQMAEWVHCDKCFRSYDITANLSLLTCGHIFCNSCLGEGKCELPDKQIHCLICEIPAGHQTLNDSLDPKLREMFCQNWTDPLLQINVQKLLFMMSKSYNYIQYLGNQISETKTILVEQKQKHTNIKAIVDQNKKVRKYVNDVSAQIDLYKEAMIIKSDEINKMANQDFHLNL